jgi:hypothetical protein
MESDSTQLEENVSSDNSSVDDANPTNTNATINSNNTSTNSASNSNINDDPTPTAATAQKKHSDASANDTVNKNTDNASAFLTANGNVIIPTTPQLTHRNFRHLSKIITPQQKEPQTNTANQTLTNNDKANEYAPSRYNTHGIKLKNPIIYESVLLDKRFKPDPEKLELTPELESLKPLILS